MTSCKTEIQTQQANIKEISIRGTNDRGGFISSLLE
jgi:hypothetical protein